ncbi:efflux RND transporter periplasmic adaptor subunit [Caulobacter mirabilis]|uniref:Efflux transporter periplasmic adaptor subunit n=1 Tax=Caulobacter mirabilis TaxID=69666 RepID=A0A2D2AX12_9CAUL|nr:efflux RND transporter periplasmic adaptor subunit [Caulobacter mirabilis]ATQ42511.1 efflux transporter periplasmic adaptor subunit [Caulobacter mirabilis]
MKVKPAYLVAGGILAVVILFFIVGGVVGLFASKEKAQAAKPQLPLVQVKTIQEESRPYVVAVRGRTEANKAVVVRAETAGPVAATPAREGAFVAKGTVLCRISTDARQASLDQARALQRTRQLEKQASDRLAAQGYRSQTQVLQAQANLDGANAQVRQGEVLLDQVNIRAPFNGVFDRREAEVGTYLSPGAACGTLIQLDPLVIVADVAERDVGGIQVGAPAAATLVSGEVIHGRVRLVTRDADPATRTYRVEIEASNPGAKARAGLSADVKITVGAGPAHLTPTAALVLDSAGRQGVRYVGAQNMVAFAPVKVLDETPQGVWVSGLRGPAQVIVVGQSYVSEGQRVRLPAPAAAR